MAYMNYFDSGMSESTNEVVHTGEYSVFYIYVCGQGRVPLVEQDLFTFPEHLRSSSVFVLFDL
jgi:hypothetical protein